MYKVDNLTTYIFVKYSIMQRITFLLLLSLFNFAAFAVGPNQLNFDGAQYYKFSERFKGNSLVAEYRTQNRNGYSRVIITHVTDKNDPNKIASDLKGKKGVDIVDVESLTPDRSDLVIRFMQFDTANHQVKNNICRIKRSANNRGSIVFQYVESKPMRNQEGSIMPDFIKVADNLKQLPVEKYSTTLSQRMVTDDDEEYQPSWHQRQQYRGHWGRYPAYSD